MKRLSKSVQLGAAVIKHCSKTNCGVWGEGGRTRLYTDALGLEILSFGVLCNRCQLDTCTLYRVFYFVYLPDGARIIVFKGETYPL